MQPRIIRAFSTPELTLLIYRSGIISMTPLLRGIPNLCHIDCGDNHIGDTGAAALAEFISRSYMVRSGSVRSGLVRPVKARHWTSEHCGPMQGWRIPGPKILRRGDLETPPVHLNFIGLRWNRMEADEPSSLGRTG